MTTGFASYIPRDVHTVAVATASSTRHLVGMKTSTDLIRSGFRNLGAVALEREVLRYRGPAIVNGVRERAIFEWLAAVPLSIGHRHALRVGARWALDGREEAAGGLVDYLGAELAVDFIGVLVATNAPPAMIQETIAAVVRYAHRKLPALIERIGGRRVFAEWCRKAQFELPAGLPETVTIARGTWGVSAEVNARGLHWSVGASDSDPFDGAAFFTGGAPDGVVVVARVPRSALIYFMPEPISLPYEVLIEDVPTDFEVVTDRQRIAGAALRFAHHRLALANRPNAIPFDPFVSTFDANAARLLAAEEAGVDPGWWAVAE